MSQVNESRFLVEHICCYSKRRLVKHAWNPKQKWNHDKCWFQCKRLINWKKGLVKKAVCGFQVTVILNVIKNVKLVNN